MNVGSIVILALVLGAAAFAAWRALKKGAPCSCGASHKTCKGGECCCCEKN